MSEIPTCVFWGPSACDQIIGSTALQVFPPAALGSVYRAVQAGFRRIAIVDGYFGNVPTVWHKEILFAISTGAEVYGASSMGAIRAAELWQYGMHGVGRVFRFFRSGMLTDDDEVCLLHGPPDTGYLPLSYAMVNVRLTVRRMRRRNLVTDGEEMDIVRFVKRLHFSRRTSQSIRMAFLAARPSDRGNLWENFLGYFSDVKQHDAATLAAFLMSGKPATPRRSVQCFDFPRTSHWKKQFELEIADIPALGVDLCNVTIASSA
jgi:hypothetical protein